MLRDSRAPTTSSDLNERSHICDAMTSVSSKAVPLNGLLHNRFVNARIVR